MRLCTVSFCVMALLSLATLARSQTPEIQKTVTKKLGEVRKVEKAKASELDDLLAQALKHNADIRVAESKVREAEAELYRARTSVMSRISSLLFERDSAKAQVEEGAKRYERELALHKRGALSPQELEAAAAAMQKFKGEAAAKQAELDNLVGKQAARLTMALAFTPEGNLIAGAEVDGTVRLWNAVTGKQSGKAIDVLFPIASATIDPANGDKLRKFLDTPFKGSFMDLSARDLLDEIHNQVKGVNIQIAPDRGNSGGLAPLDRPLNLKLGEPVPLGAVFQFIEDNADVRFVIRDYGIVATSQDRIPPGALLLHNFWKKVEYAAP